MKGLGAVVVISLGFWSAIEPKFASWVYVACIVVLFQIGVLVKMAGVPDTPVPVGVDPYRFDSDEAALVQRYRYYFTYPESAGELAGVFAAIGLIGLVLSPWLVYKEAWIQGIAIGVHTLLIGPLSRKLSPLYTLRIAANKGDAESLRLHNAHDGAWKKIVEARRLGAGAA